MIHLAPFWSWLVDGSCRLCDHEGRRFPIARPGDTTSGHATAIRRRLIDHCRAFHPEYVKRIERGDVLGPHSIVCPFRGDDRLALGA